MRHFMEFGNVFSFVKLKPFIFRCRSLFGTMRAVFQMVLGLLVFWLLVLLYMNSTLHQSDGISNQMQSQLENALNELDGLKKQNEKLRSLAQDLKNYMNFNSASKNKRQARITNLENPMKGHEVLRRSVENGVVEFWYHVSSQLGYIKKDLDGQQTNSAQNRIQDLIDAGADHQRYILKDLFNLTMLSDDWRKKESDSLGRLVQSRISFLQNPKDCSKARKLVCNINKGCGYGCQLHHLVYCFLIAYGTERTLILESRGWRYSTYGWEKYFLPLSNTCVDRSGASSHGWGKNTDDTQVVELPIVDSLHPRPPYMPLAIPKDLSDRLIALHGNPFVWWCGQFIKYLTRPQPSLAEDMKNVGSKLNFKNPIVGVHVRRTDKIGSEAAFHNLHEYMSHVDDYFSRLELQRTVDVRRVYLATDDPGVLDEARTQYPLYEFIGDASFSKTASVSSRYSDESLRAIILDIHFLSLSDYLVCTFSSQVCRVAYEIMQTLHPDAANQFKSLDDVYYFGGQTGRNQIAIAAHKARSDEEIDLLPGDIIGVAGNHWDGFSKGRNQRTGRTGIYPSYKVQEHWNIVSFPTYPQVSDDS